MPAPDQKSDRVPLDDTPGVYRNPVINPFGAMSGRGYGMLGGLSALVIGALALHSNHDSHLQLGKRESALVQGVARSDYAGHVALVFGETTATLTPGHKLTISSGADKVVASLSPLNIAPSGISSPSLTLRFEGDGLAHPFNLPIARGQTGLQSFTLVFNSAK